jgi:dienelactone hydrolase
VEDHEERAARLQELAKKKVVCQRPGMDALPVRRDVRYRAGSGLELLMDIYYPTPSSRRPPLAVLTMAYPDPTARIRAFGPLTSWAQLLAGSGIAAVVYGTEAPAEDILAVLHHVRANADALEFDVERIGLLATSANATVGLSALMRDRRLACAAFVCGYTMDLDGSTGVADASAQFGFVNACVGRSPSELSPDAPLLFVRAGLDECPGLNRALDELLRQALGLNLPVSLVNYASGTHGFAVDDASSQSQGVVEQVVSFLRLHLQA